MNPLTNRRSRALRLGAPILAATLVFSACSKKDNDKTSTEKNSSESSSKNDNTSSTNSNEASSSSPELAVSAEGVAVDKKAQVAGYIFTISKVTGSVQKYDPKGQTLTFEASVENLGADAASPYMDISLEIGPEGDREAVSATSDIPTIPGSNKGKGTITVDLSADQVKQFDLKTATMVFGGGADAQAKIPLSGDAAGITRIPVDQPQLGELTAGDWKFTPTSGLIRWDAVTYHDQVSADRAWYVVTLDITAGANYECVSDGNFVLMTPDGTAVSGLEFTTPKGASSCLDTGAVIKGATIKFELDSPVKGDYQAQVKGSFSPAGDDVEGNKVSITLNEAGS